MRVRRKFSGYSRYFAVIFTFCWNIAGIFEGIDCIAGIDYIFYKDTFAFYKYPTRIEQ